MNKKIFQLLLSNPFAKNYNFITALAFFVPALNRPVHETPSLSFKRQQLGQSLGRRHRRQHGKSR